MLQLAPMVHLPQINPNLPLDLRHATLTDVPKIYDLVKYWADKGRMLERSHELLSNSIEEFLILENSNGELAGCVGLHRMASDLAEVRGLAIHPTFQGKGLGRWLVLGAERFGRDLDLKRLFAWTYEQHFFEKCGFVRIPRQVETLPQEIHAECTRCQFQTNCQEIPMLKLLERPRLVVS
ncbi:MAG: N-acetyltransferase [Deinococcales bacterium]